MPNALAAAMNPAGSSATPDSSSANQSPGVGGQVPGAPAAGSMPGQQQPKQVSLDEVKGAIKKQSRIDHDLRTLLASGKPIPRKDAVQLCVKLVADRIFSAEDMAGYLTTLPDDPMQVRDWAAKHAQSAEMNLDKMLQMIEGQEAMPVQPAGPMVPAPGEGGPLMPGAPGPNG